MNIYFARYCIAVIGLIINIFFGFSQIKNNPVIDWEVITELPDENGIPNKGLAGSFAGVSNGVMLIAGGANFQNKMPWDGGKKFFSDKIYILEKKFA